MVGGLAQSGRSPPASRRDDVVSRSGQRPRISVVTPSYNQAPFLEACLRSVLGQKYPNLEYIVIDGGSTDGSVEIIKSFEKDLAYWVSEPDGGHYDALNKGFRRATGDILAWLNSDDMYTSWAFAVVAEIFQQLAQVQWLSTLYPLFWNEADGATGCAQLAGFDRRAVLRRGIGVQQESTFWRRSLWERAGGALDTSFKLAGDLDLWARFWEHAELYGVAVPLGGIRLHGQQQHRLHWQQYLAEASLISGRYRELADSPFRRLGETAYSFLPKRVRRYLLRYGFRYRYKAGTGNVIRMENRLWTVS
jgi:glycosyltransferase involved in cell wall biosynthesis